MEPETRALQGLPPGATAQWWAAVQEHLRRDAYMASSVAERRYRVHSLMWLDPLSSSPSLTAIQRQIAEYEAQNSEGAQPVGKPLHAAALGQVWAQDVTEVKKLLASDGATCDWFGDSVAVAGDTIVVGAVNDDDKGFESGSAYVFRRNQGGADNWGQVTKLTASDGAAADWFAYSVAAAGDTIAVGAPSDDDKGSDSGSAYVFHRNQGGTDNWGQVTKLTASDGAAAELFGYSVSVARDVIVVSAQNSAYVFHRSRGGADNWGEVAKLTASDGAAGNSFGHSVAVAGDTIVVGADRDDDKGVRSGSAYVFDRNQGGADNWGQVTKLTASDGAANEWFGSSVAVAGDVIVVGAWGSAYVFHRNQGGADNWGQVTKLTGSDGAANDSFGSSVAIAGHTIVVGAANDDDKGFESGSAYVFVRNQGGADNWGQVTKLTASDGAGYDYFGDSVAVAGDTIVVGAWGDDDKGDRSGSAYVFHDEGWPVTGEAVGDNFGISVGTAGDVDGDGYADVIIGADGYNSGTGRAYVFRGGADGLSAAPVWTATGEAVGDHFGDSVGTAGDVDGDGYADVIIGTYRRSSGRAYVYRGGADGLSAAPVWTATGEGVGEYFGVSVGTAGDVDGDGYADVIIGGYTYHRRGRAYVYGGSAGGLSAAPVWTASGEIDYECFGFSVGTAGDVDGDGYADVIVGAHNTGRAYVYRGGPDGLSAAPVWTAGGEAFVAGFGISVGTAGDVDGDGYADVVIGAWGGGSYTGRAYVYGGGAGGLSAAPVWTATGEMDYECFGYSVGTAGDVDGDGYADVIIGAYEYNSYTGRVYVYRGGAGGLSAAPVFTTTGEAIGDAFGRSVGTAGDVDGDGYADVIVGAAGYNSGTGRAYAYRGGAGGLSAAPVFTATGKGAGDYFGISVGTAGDVDGDGYADVIVGACGYNSFTGRAYVYPGGAGGLSAAPVFTATGEASGDYFGVSVGTAGDVDGDGYADVIIGAQGYNSNTGRAYVYRGGAGGFSAAPVWTATGEGTNDYFGYSVATAGDVDGDGYADVIMGANGYSGNTGRAYVYRGGAGGLSTAPVFTATGESRYDDFGRSVGTAGDVDGDGYADVIIGAYGYNGNTGRAFVYRGGAGGLSAAPVFTATGQAASNDFGHSVGTAGDVDADGYADVIVGAPGYNSFTGRAYVYRGGAGALSTTPVFTATGEWMYDFFGFSVGTAGDAYGGDGYADVIVGAPYYSDRGRAYVFRGAAGGLSAAPVFTTTGEATRDQFGISVGTAGDVDGDGYADVIIGAMGYNSYTGRAYVYAGNGGGGRRVLARGQRGDGSGLEVQPWGLTYRADGFQAQLNATDPRGRERVKLQVEACPPGVPFSDASCSTFTSPTWEDVTATAAGVTLAGDIAGLAGNTLYRWRARVLYAPFHVTEPGITAPPNPPHGPWRRFLGQALEADLRTGPIGAVRTLYLPVIRGQ